MIIVRSKEWTEVYEKCKEILVSTILNFSMGELGIDSVFLDDSKTIQDSIKTISSRIATLKETTEPCPYIIPKNQGEK